MADSSLVILNRMLSNIDSKYDKTDGSFFYDLNTPTAIELNLAYGILESILIRRNIATSTGDDLTRLCDEMGITRHPATYSIGFVTIKGVAGAVITQGDLVASGLINFEIMENAVIPEGGEITVAVQSKVLGAIGNVPVGSIKSFPKTLQGLTEVTNTATLTGGYDQESDESLKERYYIKVRTPATSGNKYHYLSWARDVSGVGSAKVYPLWNGNGTVKVVIADSNKRGASQELVDNTFNYIESQRPIGANVTVISAIEKATNITANVTLAVGQDINTIKTQFTSTLTTYLKSVAFNTTYISIAQVGNLLLDTGIVDYIDLKINGLGEPLRLTEEEIAVIGSVTLGVV